MFNRKLAIYPQIFAEADFVPAFVTDHDIIQGSSSSSLNSQAFQSNLINEQTYSACLNTSHYHQGSTAVDQSAHFLAKATPTSSVLDTASNFVSPQEVLPLPKAASRKNSNRKRGKTKIYTDTPVCDEIAKRQAQKRAQKSAEKKMQKEDYFAKERKHH